MTPAPRAIPDCEVATPHLGLEVNLDEFVIGGTVDPSVLLTLRLNDLPLHLLLLEVTATGPYGWPEPVDEDYSSYVGALYDVWDTTKPPTLLAWQGRRWLVTTEPFER